MEYLPFKPKQVQPHGENLLDCGLYNLLPENQKEYISKNENKHLLNYLHMLPLDKIGLPQFHPKLSKDLKKLKNPNLIYPVGNGISIHVYPDEKDIRNYYIPVEPDLFLDVKHLLFQVEQELVNCVSLFEGKAETIEEKKKLLNEALEEICVIKGSEKGFFSRAVKSAKNRIKFKKRKSIYVTPEEFQAIRYIVIRDKIGMGVLEPLLLDPYIEDISCSGVGTLFVEHRIFSGLKTTINFKDMAELNKFSIQLSEKIGRPLTYRDPIVDAALPEGSRVNIVFGEDVSKRGSNFTIRRATDMPLSILELISLGTLDYKMAAYLWIMLKEGMNCFIVGETASGKTTMLNALTTFIRPNSKIVSIEDTPELQVPHKNWTREVTRASRAESNSDVSMFDLLKAALRQRPNEILVGEIRGVEGNIAFQAMQTGHPVMSTFHAASVEKVVQRLTGDPINVPKAYIDNLNIVVCQNAVHLPGKGVVRRVTSINEVVGYNPISQTFTFIEAFQWDPVSDKFTFRGHMNSYILENKIAYKWGLSRKDRKTVYRELQRREKILQKIQKSKITGFYDLFSILGQLEEGA